MKTAITSQTESGIKLNTTPELIQSHYLSAKTGLNIWVLDYSCTDTGTHKLKKAIASVQKAKEQGKNFLLHINPVVDSRWNSNGSGSDALELASAVDYPESQPVNIVHRNKNSNEPRFKSEYISPKFRGRKRLTYGLDLNEFWGKERLEEYFQDILGDCVDITNLKDCSCYHLSKEMIERLKENEIHCLISPTGTAESTLGQIESIDGLIHMPVIPQGHVLDPFHRYEEGNAKRVLTRFKVDTHDRLVQRAIDNKHILFKTVGLYADEYAKGLFERAIKQDKLGMKTGYDGAIGFSVLRERDNPEHKDYFTDTGLKIFNSYLASKAGFNYQRDIELPFGSNICIVNTGISNNLFITKLIEGGEIS